MSEQIIGKALTTYKIPRESVVIMTKCRFATSAPGEPQLSVFASTVNDGRMVNRAGLSRKHILDAVQASVKRLGTYIDVIQIQRMDPDVPREEIMRALNDVVEMGLARYIGASSVGLATFPNYSSTHACRAFSSSLYVTPDACLGIPGPSERSTEAWLAPVHLHAELLQPSLQRGGAGDDTLLSRRGCRTHSSKKRALVKICCIESADPSACLT